MSIYSQLTSKDEKEKKKQQGLKPSQIASEENKPKVSLYQQLTAKTPEPVPEPKKPSLFENIKTGVSDFFSKVSGKKKAQEVFGGQEPTKLLETKPIAQQPIQVQQKNIFDLEMESARASESVPSAKATIKTQIKKPTLIEEVAKFGARTAIGVADLATEGLDFVADTIATNLVDKKKPQWKVVSDLNDKWVNYYNEQSRAGNVPTQNLKNFVDKLQQIEFIQPTKEWDQASIGDKIKKYPLETVLNVFPSVLSSAIAFGVNPGLGFVLSATSTANDVKDQAIERGVDENKATNLGLGTGIVVGLLDKVVPDKVFSKKKVKEKFISSLAKRLFGFGKTVATETTTEVVQEGVQMAAEKTFREDLGWDEAKTRFAMSAMGGALGGSVFGGIDEMMSNVRSDIENKPENGQKGNKVEMTPEAAIETVTLSDLRGTDAGNTIIATAQQAQREGKMVVINQGSVDQSVVETPDGNKISVSVSESPTIVPKVTEEKQVTLPEATQQMEKTTPVPAEVEKRKQLAEQKKKVLEATKVGPEGETTTKKVEVKPLTEETRASYVKLAQESSTAKSFLNKIGKDGTAQIRSGGDTVVNFFNESNKEITISDRINTLIAREKKLTESMSGSQKESALRGIGMQYSAIKRQIEGNPTEIEIRNARKYLESRHTGKKVIIDGKEAVLTGKMSFGKSQVKFSDGSTKFVSGDDVKSEKISNGEVIAHIKSEATKKLEGKERMFKITTERVETGQQEPKREFSVIQKPEVNTEKSTEIAPVKKKQTLSKKVNTAKNVTSIKSALRSVRKQFSQLVSEAEGKVAVAKEQREGLNTKDIAKLKRAYNRSQRFQEGDIETMRDSKFQKLVDSVVEDVQIKYPDLSEEEAFDFALNLPTKAEERFVKSEDMVKLMDRQKVLQGYLNTLEAKQAAITGQQRIEEGNAVFDEWRSVMDQQEKLTKLITAQERQTAVQKPIEETPGTPKLSRVAERVLNQLINVQESDITYKPLSIIEDAAKATEFSLQNPEIALRIAKGLELPPPDITETAISIAMAERARRDGDFNLYSQLVASRTLRQTRRGQEIVVERGRMDENSSEYFMKQLLAERARIVESGKKWKYAIEKKAAKIQNIIKDETTKLKQQIDKKVLTKLESAQKLIDSLTCKI